MAQKPPSFNGKGFMGAGGGGGFNPRAIGSTTSKQAKANRSGQSVAQNYRASGQASGSVAKPKGFMSKLFGK